MKSYIPRNFSWKDIDLIGRKWHDETSYNDHLPRNHAPIEHGSDIETMHQGICAGNHFWKASPPIAPSGYPMVKAAFQKW